jgi:hypothetical protein
MVSGGPSRVMTFRQDHEARSDLAHETFLARRIQPWQTGSAFHISLASPATLGATQMVEGASPDQGSVATPWSLSSRRRLQIYAPVLDASADTAAADAEWAAKRQVQCREDRPGG